MSLPPGFLDELRSRVSLAQLVGRKVTWDPRKSNAGTRRLLGALPVPSGKDRLVPRRRRARAIYYCFGCHAKGDAVTFLRETENLGFIEAVERLAARGRHGDARPRPGRRRARRRRTRASPRRWRPRSASTAAARAAPAPPRLAPISTAAALAPATRERFELGFAPDARTALLEHLTAKGFARDAPRRGRADRPAPRRRQPLRPLPRPDRLPDPRRPRPRHRLRRPRARRRARSRST